MKGPFERILSVQIAVKVWSSVTEEKGRRKNDQRERVKPCSNYQMELRETRLVRGARRKLTTAPVLVYAGIH